MQEAGLNIIGDYDVSDLTGIEVPGFQVLDQQKARDILQPLTEVFNFDGLESDYILKFLTRSQSSTATITEGDMIAQTNDLVYEHTRIEELELPQSIQLTTGDPDNDFQQATQQAQRVLFPAPTVASASQLSFEAPVFIDQTDARQSAEINLFRVWNERNVFTFRTSWEFLRTDPGDVITLSLDNGLTTLARVEQTIIGADLVMEFRVVGQGEGLYVSNIIGGESDSIQNNIPIIKNSQLFLLDTPFLRDVDATALGVSRIYWAGSSFDGSEWPGGVLSESLDNQTFEALSSKNIGVSHGVTTADLPVTAEPFVWDDENTITFTPLIGGDQFSSSTDESVLNGANAVGIIRPGSAREVEVIQFVNVLQNANSTITLSRLLRGRRGTEVFGVTPHLSGSQIVLLRDNLIDSYLDAASEFNQPHFYKLTTVGQDIDDAPVVNYTPQERSLKPRAPHNQQATTNVSDIDITWVRRTRFNTNILTTFGTVPLNEETEEYELEILDGPGGSIVRTVTGLTTPFYKYLNADFTSDLGGTPTELTIQVYQISASIGRGFTTEITIPVL